MTRKCVPYQACRQVCVNVCVQEKVRVCKMVPVCVEKEVCVAPCPPACPPCPDACAPACCDSGRGGLFGHLRARRASRHAGGDCCEAATCGAAAGAGCCH
jgi:hypothetical protein